MQERLVALREEHDKGLERLAALDRERERVRDTVLRISGAIQVLEELLQARVDGAPRAEEVEARAS
jgi:hypothetical protein